MLKKDKINTDSTMIWAQVHNQLNFNVEFLYEEKSYPSPIESQFFK